MKRGSFSGRAANREKPRPPKGPGFSLIETVVMVALLALMLAIGLSHRPSAQGSVRGAAEALAEELREARREAMSKRYPVGVALPRGATQCSQSFYVVGGPSQPRIERTRDFSTEGVGAYFFSGYWNGAASLALGATQMDGWNLATWPPPYPTDATFVFTPSGNVISSEALIDGGYQILVGTGLAYSAGAVSGQALPQLTSITGPISVTVLPAGTIFLNPGLPDRGSVAVGSSTTIPGPATPARFPTQAANHAPTISLVAVDPQPTTTMPAGADATCVVGGHLTLRAQAQDVDGDPLYISWTSVPAGGGPGGAFSLNGESIMEWSAADGVWNADWTWSPPPTATQGQIFTLSCAVSDHRGGVTNANIGVAGEVMALLDGRIYFEGYRDSPSGEIYSMNPDGTDVIRLTKNAGGDRLPHPSPDGTHILFWSNRTGVGEQFIMKADGTGVHQLTDRTKVPPAQAWVNAYNACWSPDGTMIAFNGSNGIYTSQTIWVVNADGTNYRALGTVNPATLPIPQNSCILPFWDSNVATATNTIYAGNADYPGTPTYCFPFPNPFTGPGTVTLTPGYCEGAVSPDFKYILAVNTGFNVGLWNHATIGGASIGLSGLEPAWAPDDSRIVYHAVSGPYTQIFIANKDGSGQKRLTNTPSNNRCATWGIN